MSKKVAKNKDAGVHDEGETPRTDEPATAPTESASVVEKPSDGKKIEILGVGHEVGDTVMFGDLETKVVEERQLPASPNSGVPAGVYPVVSMLLKPGNRTAYRAVVAGTLYPIREYGTVNAVISKIRGESKPRVKKNKVAASVLEDTAAFSLTGQATKILDAYLDLKTDGDRGSVLSELVTRHLGPEVERMQATREAIQKLPHDLLAALAGATEEKRQQVFAMLK